MSTDESAVSGGARDQALEPQSVGDADAELLAKLGYKQELNRAMGLFSSFGVQFTSIAIASGIYTTMVVGFGFFGPASFWSYVVGGALQVFFVGLAVAQLVSAFPLSGGVYQIVGRLTKYRELAWQGGWWLVIAHTAATAAVAVSLVPFIASWFGYNNLSGLQTSLIALALIVIVTIFNLVGVKAAALLNNVGVVAEICGCILIIGALLLVKHHTQPLSILNDSGGTAAHGWVLPFLYAMILPAYAISSFDATGNAAEETKDAARTAPMGTFLANTSAYFVGLVFIFLTVRAIPNVDKMMASSTPMKYVLDSAVGNTLTTVFEVIAIVSMTATMCMLQLTGVRVLWSQARDGQMPAAHWLRKVSQHRIPLNATVVCFVLPVIFVFWSSALSVLSALTALAWALAYGVVVCAGMWAISRKKLPKSPFHLGAFAPAVFAIAIIWSAVLCFLLIKSDPKHVGLGMLGVIVIGAIMYRTIPASRRGQIGDAEYVPEISNQPEGI